MNIENLSISIIIPTMNRHNVLRETLESLLEKKYTPNEIIIVDQSDKKIEKKLNISYCEKHDNIKYIFQDFPSSTKARNIGLKSASNDIIIFCDDDILVFEDTLKNVNHIMENKNISMIGGIDVLSKTKNSLLSYVFLNSSFTKRKIGHISKGMYGRFPVENKLDENIYTEWAMGFFFVIRKKNVLEWNLSFDENLTSYAYAEDLDFTYNYYRNSKKSNLKCIISKKVKVKHMISQDYRIPSFKATLMVIMHREYIRHKYFKSKKYIFFIIWSNFGKILEMIVRFQNPFNHLKANLICYFNIKKIRKGQISELLNKY